MMRKIYTFFFIIVITLINVSTFAQDKHTKEPPKIPKDKIINPYKNTIHSDAVSGITFSQSSSSYTAITGGTVLISGTFDDGNIPNQSLPFGFVFNGIAYTTFNVNYNGFITFGSTLPPGGYPYTPISDNTAYAGAISALGRDLQGNSGGELRYQVIGSAPNRIAVIQWSNMRKYGAAGDNFNFQICLYEYTNNISVIYGTMTSNTSDATPQIGLRGTSNADFNNRTTTNNWAATTAGVANNATCSLTSTVFPASGLTFTWTQGIEIATYPWKEYFNVWPPPNFNLTGGTMNWTPYVSASDSSAFCDFWDYNEGYYALMQTPLLNLTSGTGLTAPTLMFRWSHMYMTYYPNDSLGVYITSNGGASWNALWGLKAAAFNSNDGASYTTPGTYVNAAVDMSAYLNQRVNIRFAGYSGYGPDAFIADVSVINGGPPIVSTTTPSNITINTATSGGTISSQGASSVTARGVCWNLTGNPTTTDAHTSDGTGIGTYTSNITGLASNTLYHVRAYATNTQGTSYGSDLTFTTLNAMTYTSSTSLQSNLNDVTCNTCSNEVLDLQILTSGAGNPLHATCFSLNTSGTTNVNNIANAKLWSTGTSSAFATTTQVGSTISSPNGIMTFNGDVTLSAGTNYFWLTYDVVNNATPGNVIDAQFTTCTVAGLVQTPLVQNPAGARSIWNNNYGGGSVCGGYYFANNVPGSGAINQPPYNWIDPISNGHTVLTDLSWTNSGDDGYFMIPDIGFNFYFFGNAYRNNVYIGSNGYITFGSGNSNLSAYQLPNASAPLNMIAAAERDLDCRISSNSDCAIYYGGDASKFVITYYHVHLFGSSTVYITFQIILYPNGSPATNSNFRINYNDDQTSTISSNSILTSCSVGINNGSGTSGVNYRYPGSHQGPMFNGYSFSPNGASALALEFGINNGTLPVELKSFTSGITNHDVNLTWSTSSETNNAGFDIERQSYISDDHFSDWQKIGFVKGIGNNSALSNYSFKDSKLNTGKYKYRLKQIDNNGNFNYFSLNNVVEIGLPAKFNLSQNYPNPFNPMTKIDYDLPSDSRVLIIIYDMLGREMKTLVNDFQKAGYYTVQLNATNFASGVYFYRFIANGKDINLTKKMMVIK